MSRALVSLSALALLAAGCAEDELDHTAPRLAESVQLSHREPGAACRPLECVEVRSGRDDEPSADALRIYAAERHANYIVIDTFALFDGAPAPAVLTRARLFCCPALAFAAAAY